LATVKCYLSIRLAISLDPENASAHQWYANLLATLGRADEAEQEVRRAQELDKTSLIVKRTSRILSTLRIVTINQ